MSKEQQIKTVIAEDVPDAAELMVEICESQGIEAISTPRGDDLLKLLSKGDVDILLLDLSLEDSKGKDLLHFFHEACKIKPTPLIIIITSNPSYKRAFRAAQEGAYDFIEKASGGFQRLEIALRNAVDRIKIQRQLDSSKRENTLARSFISRSPQIEQLFQQLDKIARTNEPVLILGEPGVGKELISRHITQRSRRAGKAFRVFNSAAIIESIIEGTLFGWKKGSFAGAVADHDGIFKQADGGTLFLDEIGDMSLSVQSKILRAIEYGEIEPVGSIAAETVDVRLITATNKNLQELIDKYEFRGDLNSRLNVFTFCIPPLRERPEDIELLAHHFFDSYCIEYKTSGKILTDEAVEVLKQKPLNENVRTLKMIIMRLALLAEVQYITGIHVEVASSDNLTSLSISDDLSMNERMANFKISVIKTALAKHNNSVKDAAAELKIDKATLYKKLEKYGLR